MAIDKFLQRPSSLLGSTVRSQWVQLLWDKGQKDLGKVEEVLGSPLFPWAGPEVRRCWGGVPSTTCSFPSSHSPKPWKSQKNPEGRPWIYLLSCFPQKLESNVAFMISTWMPRPPGSYYQLCLPIPQFAKCHN